MKIMDLNKLASDVLTLIEDRAGSREAQVDAVRTALTLADGGGYLRCMEEHRRFLTDRVDSMLRGGK